MINAADIPTYRSSFLRKVCISLFLILFFSVNSFGQDPNYVHNTAKSRNLDQFTLTTADAFNPQAKIDRLIISVATNPNGERFVLTFGNGIKRVGDNDGLIDFIPNQSNRLSNPLDLAINSDGKFYVATNESNRRFIRVYSPQGAYLGSEVLGNGAYGSSGPDRFKGPTGLTFDQEDNLYVADHYIGNANPPRPSSIKIYRKDASGNYKNNLINEFDEVDGSILRSPYRLAVNSTGQLYMAELGQNGNASVKILELDANFNPTQIDEITGPEIGAPGSIIIDKFDNIFIADFGEEINLARVLEATDDVDEFYEVFEIIKDGIENNLFNVNIYNSDNSFRSKISSKIDFPIDLAISNCGTLYVNNTIFDGQIRETCIFGFCVSVPDISIDFDLEVYDRSAGYDSENPVLVTCPNNRDAELVNGVYILPDYTTSSEFTDDCDSDLELVQTPAPGSSISETTEISIVAIDESGNESETCTFLVVISAPEDTPPEFDNCSRTTIHKTNDPGECGAEVRFDTPTASDESGNVEVTRVDENTHLFSGSLFPVGTTTITFQANDGTKDPVTCSFDIVVEDNENPEFLSCPTNFNETVPFGEPRKVINYEDPTFDDNCPGTTIIQNAGLPTGSEFPVGSTTNTFVITDKIGNTATCSFTVTITEEAEDTPPEFDNCSTTTITTSNDPGECGAVVTFVSPTASDENGNVEVTRIDENIDLVSGSLFPVGTTKIIFQATDGTNDPVTCSFDIVVQDTEAPILTCVPDITAQASPGNDSRSINFSLPTARDNCDGVLQSRVAEGSLVSGSNFPIGSTDVVFEATDSNGNIGYCTLNVNILPPNYAPSIACPADISVPNDSGVCGAIVEFPEPTVTDPEGDDLTIIRTDNLNLNSGDIFPVGTTTVVYQVSDGINPPVSCNFTITVENTEQPNFTTCPDDISELLDASESGKIVPFDLPQFEDNCSEAELFQTAGPSSGEFFELGETEVRFELRVNNTVVDQCSFSVNLLRQTATYQCIESITVNLGEDAQNSSVTEIPTSEFILSDSSNLDFELNVQQFTCEDIGTVDLPIRATDRENGEEYSCTVEVTVRDVGAPLIICPAEPIRLQLPENGYIVPDLFENNVSDNCNDISQLDLLQAISPGTLLETSGTYRIDLTAIDIYGNKENCEVTIILEENDSSALQITCPGKQILDIGDQCEIALPDYTSLVSTNPSVEIIQTPAPGTIIEYTQDIGFTATLDGEVANCSFELEVINPANDYSLRGGLSGVNIFVIGPDEEGKIVEFDPPEVIGACGEVNITQTQGLVSGSLFPLGETIVQFTVVDEKGRVLTSSFGITVVREQEPQEFALNCPQNESVLRADDNCEYIVPDFSNTIIYSPANANFSQSIPAGTRIEQSTNIEITASFDGESDSCTFELVLKDNTSPVLSCPDDRMIVVAEGESVEIPDFRGELEVSDNCGLAEIIQDPAPGTLISEDTEVSFIAFDTSNTNNASECSFMLTLVVDTEGNDIPIANEDFYSTPVNRTLNISVEEGVLTNDMDADGDELTATLVENVTNGTLEFESDGSFVYTPDDGFIGDDFFKYYVFDGFTEVETTVTISVVPVDTEGFQCVEAYVLELDENGTAQLQITELYTGDASEATFSLDQEFFDCDDLGTNQVTLSYTGVENGSCGISIEVVDRIKPEIEVQSIGVDLDLSGNATITSQDVIVSFSDNCDNDLSYELSRSTFSCKDLGWNEINVIATDASGNSTTTSVEVQVFAESGICNGTVEGSEYIFIYPNPNQGSFKVATPADVTISRIEVFDHRGRFITGKDYPANALEYAISTGPLQEAVYVVKMITNEGEKTKRFIIKN
ncbi:HYR domain-containing protein [uncultured Christiangramia sp.]|uniref:HYR domain-containing protein n=1 Tax=uncultured Christiangramia sp. TaxID=503836 RepID=UPI00263A111F|nr:HYR domain-containing protein [uncultured Christiangramia sp.]